MDSFKIKVNCDLYGRNASKAVFAINHLPTNSVYIELNDRRVNAKSILGLLSLGVKKGDEITVYADLEYKTDILNVFNEIESL